LKYRLKSKNLRPKVFLVLESSKSESNRVLVINALAGGNTSDIHNISNARDTQTMLRLLSETPLIYDVKDAGTTMRFLTAFLGAFGKGETITGTDRMKQRPIGPLVDALRILGAEIEYLEKEGYPPLKIKAIENQASKQISIPGNISSQYISALLMIGPTLPNGLALTLTTEVFSQPYIEMTLSIMKRFGVVANWEGNTIQIEPQTYQPTSYTIEGDWSGASYWYALIALSEKGSELTLSPLREDSTQGDQAIANIMENLGVETHYANGQLTLKKKEITERTLNIDFKDCPDLAQTVLVTASVNDVSLKMTGLESLKIKETDRVAAMTTELAKIGATLNEIDQKWELTPSSSLPESVSIDTYEDHRMAMAFAPLSLLMEVIIDDPMVVNKSYPSFWEHIHQVGIAVEEM